MGKYTRTCEGYVELGDCEGYTMMTQDKTETCNLGECEKEEELIPGETCWVEGQDFEGKLWTQPPVAGNVMLGTLKLVVTGIILTTLESITMPVMMPSTSIRTLKLAVLPEVFAGTTDRTLKALTVSLEQWKCWILILKKQFAEEKL